MSGKPKKPHTPFLARLLGDGLRAVREGETLPEGCPVLVLDGEGVSDGREYALVLWVYCGREVYGRVRPLTRLEPAEWDGRCYEVPLDRLAVRVKDAGKVGAA